MHFCHAVILGLKWFQQALFEGFAFAIVGVAVS